MFLNFFKSSKSQKSPQELLTPIRVVLMGQHESITVDLKKIFTESFQKYPFFAITTEDNFLGEDFLNSNNKNFFDFYDNGIKIIKKHHADVLICFYPSGTNIRFHFLTPNTYLQENPPFFSTLFALYLPISYFQMQNLPSQIGNLIASTCVALSLKKDVRYEKILKKFVDDLSKNKMPEGVEKRFVPHILSFLAFNYLALRSSVFSKKDMKLILGLLNFAYQLRSDLSDGILEGTLLVLLGQMYVCAADAKTADSYKFLERGIESIKKALKYFNKYIFPYDYGHLSFILAKLYFAYFKLQDKRQALRDAVYYMRQAQKIFTQAAFPYFWADIEGYLGHYLMNLSFYAETKDITEIAVQNYKNRQKVYQKQSFPILWAETEKNIADAYYYSAKNLNNAAFLTQASDHYYDALEVFELQNNSLYVQIIENILQKIDEKNFPSNQK